MAITDLRIIRSTAALLAAGFASAVVFAQAGSPDITQWRGANRDGAVPLTAPSTWPDQLTQKWKVDVGEGYATPLVAGNRVYVFSRQGDNEGMSALDADSGKVLWRTGYPAPFKMHSGAVSHGPGPKSTPVLFNGRLYSIGMTGIVTAYDAATGRRVWQKPGSAVVPTYASHAFSPIVDSSVVIFHLGGHNEGALSALDLATGAPKWSWTGDGPGYGSPIIATLNGTRQLVTISQSKIVGLDVATGALLWERPFLHPSVNNMITPIVAGPMVITGGTAGPTTGLTVSKTNNQWTATPAWENADVPLRMSTAVVVGSTLFGLSSRNAGQYFAVDTATGKTLWTSDGRQAGSAAIVTTPELFISLEDDGDLVVARASRTAFEPLKRYKVATTDTYAPPAISGNRIFIKDVSSLTLWTVS